MAGRLKSMNEHGPLVNALLGTESSPMAFLESNFDATALFSGMGQETALSEVQPQMSWDFSDMGLFSDLLAS